MDEKSIKKYEIINDCCFAGQLAFAAGAVMAAGVGDAKALVILGLPSIALGIATYAFTDDIKKEKQKIVAKTSDKVREF